MATDYKMVVVPDTGGTRPCIECPQCLGLQLLYICIMHNACWHIHDEYWHMHWFSLIVSVYSLVILTLHGKHGSDIVSHIFNAEMFFISQGSI